MFTLLKRNKTKSEFKFISALECHKGTLVSVYRVGLIVGLLANLDIALETCADSVGVSVVISRKKKSTHFAPDSA
jgi:hypothetical protein